MDDNKYLVEKDAGNSSIVDVAAKAWVTSITRIGSFSAGLASVKIMNSGVDKISSNPSAGKLGGLGRIGAGISLGIFSYSAWVSASSADKYRKIQDKMTGEESPRR